MTDKVSRIRFNVVRVPCFYKKQINLWYLNEVIKYHGNYKSIENDTVKTIERYNCLNVVYEIINLAKIQQYKSKIFDWFRNYTQKL